jgi:hypothetical protein
MEQQGKPLLYDSLVAEKALKVRPQDLQIEQGFIYIKDNCFTSVTSENDIL